MGIIMDILRRMAEKRRERAQIPDDETRDNYLRSLRRQRRVQLEELEKENLKQQINEFEKQKVRDNIYGFKDDFEERKAQLKKEIKIKKGSMIMQKNMFLGAKKGIKNILTK